MSDMTEKPSSPFVLWIRRVINVSIRFTKNILKAIEEYLRNRVRNLPSVLPKNRMAMVDQILQQPHHQDFLNNFAAQSKLPLDQVKGNFRRYLSEIASDMNYLAFPFWDALLTWIFDSIYEGLDVEAASLEKIREASHQKPVVFVSNHRSHMDYLLLSYIFYYHRISMPYICAGTNLSFWPLGKIFRKSGAFFIRRSYDGNKLYAQAVQAYIENLIHEKSTLEFFIEGGRSRTGKLLPPKLGILSAIQQAYRHGAYDDVLLIPTTVTYESILEEKSYAEEKTGKIKKNETIWDLFRLRKFLKKKKGKVYIRFENPISLKEQFQNSPVSEDKAKTEALAYDLTYGINKGAIITVSSLVAMVLLSHRKRSMTMPEIHENLAQLLHYAHYKKCTLSEPILSNLDAAVREILKKYVREHLLEETEDKEEGFESLFTVPDAKRNLLDYYKNTSLHYFVSLSVTANILLRFKEISKQQFIENFTGLQKLFLYEFTFSRQQPAEFHVEKLFHYLLEQKWVSETPNDYSITDEGQKKLCFFASLLQNFFETYWVAWTLLQELPADRIEQRDLLKKLHKKCRIAYLREKITYLEANNKFVFQNTLNSFRDQGLLVESKEGFGKKKKVFYTRNTSVNSQSISPALFLGNLI